MASVKPDQVLCCLRAANKKTLLAELAKAASSVTGVHESQIFDVLIERERLASTGLGKGIAIPHGKLAGVDRVYELFARLEKPVDFEAIDGLPVDLVYLLLAPAGAGADHLQALSRVSRLLRDETTCAKLRGTDSVDALSILLTEERTQDSPAPL